VSGERNGRVVASLLAVLVLLVSGLVFVLYAIPMAWAGVPLRVLALALVALVAVVVLGAVAVQRQARRARQSQG
jgi:hypothetical protein